MSIPPEAERRLETLLEDKVSLAISSLLLSEGASSVFKMHEKTGHSRPTIYERVRKLLSAGVLLSWESGREVLYDVVPAYREPLSKILARKGVLLAQAPTEAKSVKEAWVTEKESPVLRKHALKSFPAQLPAYFLYAAGLVFTAWAILGAVRVPDPLRLVAVLVSIAVVWVIILRVRQWFSLRQETRGT